MAKSIKSNSKGLALMRAAEKHDFKAIARFLAAGADPKTTNRQGWTAINFAVFRDREKALPTVQLLFDAGCPAGRGCLGWPMVTGDLDLIRLLIKGGADVNAPSTNADRDFAGWTPVGRAVQQHGVEESMRKIRKKMGAEFALRTDENKARWLAIIEDLIAAGADPDGKSNFGSAREIATRNKDETVLALLPKAKIANPAAKSRATPTVKHKPFKPANVEGAGAREFLDCVFKGEPEWAVLLVEAPLVATLKALQKSRKFRHWNKDVVVRPMGKDGDDDDEGPSDVAVVSVRGSPWTIVMRSIFHLSLLELREVPEDASALSKALKVRTATFMGEDTSASLGYELYDRGVRVERIDWSGGEVTRFESKVRKRPKWPADDFEIADTIFRDLGAYLPPCFAYCVDGDHVYVVAEKKVIARIARADVITL